MADELHQEFLLRLCEMDQLELEQSKQGGYLDWTCFTVIRNIWSRKKFHKQNKNGKTSPFFEYVNNHEVEDIGVSSEDALAVIEPDIFASCSVIQQDINSSDIELNFKARVFAYSVGMRIDNGIVNFGGKFKSERAFARESGIPHSTAYKAFNEYKSILKTKLNLC